MKMIYEEVLEKVNFWVDEVAKYQLKHLYNRDFSVNRKGSQVNLVTDIDVESEKMLTNFIKENYKNHSILGEELGEQKCDNEYTWVIDPIDGTTNFVHGFPMYSISIALKHNDITVLGLVYAPIINMKFCAIKGKGAYLNGKKIKVSSTEELIDSLLATGFQYNRGIENTNLKYFNNIINNISGIRRTGSAALDLCLVGCGALDGYWEFDLNEWDICAGVLIIKEAQGVITCMERSNHPILIAGNLSIHNKLKKFINSIEELSF
jgi:myo-inositol-1(or 4)-monophosphatase